MSATTTTTTTEDFDAKVERHIRALRAAGQPPEPPPPPGLAEQERILGRFLEAMDVDD